MMIYYYDVFKENFQPRHISKVEKRIKFYLSVTIHVVLFSWYLHYCSVFAHSKGQ